MGEKSNMKDFLYDHAAVHPVSFHMPGHKGAALFKKYGYEEFLENFMDMDVTEIPGADNLFDANGIIADVQARYADLYGARHSWLSVGGTSASLIASILAACDPAQRGIGACGQDNVPKMIIARNCHKSVYNGLTLAGVQPVYAYPEIIEEYGISGEVTAEEIERCIRMAPDAAGVVVTSPNYYGICSDIEKIAEVVHRAGMILIVDQAHGAHLKFFHKFGCQKIIMDNKRSMALPKAAEDQGADLVANSTHKTLASMTQSAILNLCSDRVDPELIEDKLQMIESSSPSYILMSSLDINAEMIEQYGKELFENWHSDLEWFYSNASGIPGLVLMGQADDCLMFDFTKLNIDAGLPGGELEKMLNKRGIFPELYAGNILMCMTGIGNVRKDYERLLSELKKEMAEYSASSKKPSDSTAVEVKADRIKIPVAGEMKGIPVNKEKIPLEESAGRICAASIIPYPPGSPIVCPGEVMTREMIDYLRVLLSEEHKIIGIDDDDRIFVGR